jgi:hypothetical protein
MLPDCTDFPSHDNISCRLEIRSDWARFIAAPGATEVLLDRVDCQRDCLTTEHLHQVNTYLGTVFWPTTLLLLGISHDLCKIHMNNIARMIAARNIGCSLRAP